MKHLLEDKLLEKILKECSQKRNIKKVKERQCNRIVNQGDNYVSITWQEIVEVANEDGAVWKESLIVKSAPPGEHAKEFIEREGLFQKEITMYTEVLPKMEKLMKSIENCGERLWPRYLGMKPYNIIILEDLTAKGFKKVDRRQGLDLDHSLLAFKALAKFHTLSIALKDELMLDSKEFIRFDSTQDRTRKFSSFNSKVKALAQIMRNEWEPKWGRLAEHLENNVEQILDRFVKICDRKEKNFNVLNHGDPWTSNMLFKYSEYTGKVCGIRFVDYQVRHYNSFAIDLQYLLQTSVQADVIKERTDELLIAYHETLLSTSNKLQLNNNVIPSLSAIKAEMKEKTLVGLWMAIILLDMMLVEPSDALDLDTILKNKWNSDKLVCSGKCLYKMQAILEPYIQKDFTCL